VDESILEKESRYMNFLPALYQEGTESAAFIGRFLKIFEKILTGIDDNVAPNAGAATGYNIHAAPITISDQLNPGIEQTIDSISEFFDPTLVPAEFLSWLSGWVALVMRDNWDIQYKRRLLKKIVPLYKIRGTKKGITQYLKIFVGDNLKLEENTRGILVGTPGGTKGIGTIGQDTFVGGFLPHFFIVTITYARIDALNVGDFLNSVSATKAVLDLEKPAHTYYALRLKVPGIYVGRNPDTGDPTRIGINTVIGRSYPFFV
jgi:phage tail-like protein